METNQDLARQNGPRHVTGSWFNTTMQTFAVTYVYQDNPSKLDQVRPAHRAYLQALAVTGTVRASGPVKQGEMNGALIVVCAPSADEALALLAHDPFYTEGLVVDRAIVEWNIVIGPWASL